MEPIVTVSPSDELDFVDGGPAVVRVRNVSRQNVIYKVRTTAPEWYLIKPHQGLVRSGQEVQVNITIKKNNEDAAARAKFQILAASCDSEKVSDVAGALEVAPSKVNRVLQVRKPPSSRPSSLTLSPASAPLITQKQQLETEKHTLEQQLRHLQAWTPAPERETEAEYSALYLVLVLVLGCLVGRYLPFALA